MVIMDIQAAKLELMHLLLQTEKESLLIKLKKVFEEEGSDWWDELDDFEKKAVEKGLDEANKGKLSAHDEVMKRFNK